MPPKKGKVSKVNKAKKEAEAAPEHENSNGTVEEHTSAKAEEESAPKDAPATNDTPAEDGQTNNEAPAVEDVPATKDEPAAEATAASDDVAAGDAVTNGNEKETKPDAEPEAQEKPSTKSKKRKADDTTQEPSKASRRSVRGTSKAQPSQLQLLNYLLSHAAADLCRPEEEAKYLEEHGKDARTYSGAAMSPFEELVCAVILSRPISHRLGLRTIRTILNSPYEFTTPKAIKDAGEEKRSQALWDAKTQHKGKTAEQLGGIADVISSKFGKDDTDTSLDKLRNEARHGWDEERDLLQSNIKGLGKTGLDIFFRRVQWLWDEAFPFVDERTGRGLDKLGLSKNPDELFKSIEEHWSKLDTSSLVKADKATLKRRAFVLICERATGAELEGKVEALLEAAASA